MHHKGTKEGTKEEILFTKKLNKKVDLSYWDRMKISSLEHHAIRVIYKKYGKLNKSKVLSKADIFLAKGNVPIEYLKSKDYFLDEDDMKKFLLEPLPYSGISVKRVDSKKYQIMKMGASTFKKLFGSNILATGASIYSTKEKDFSKNIDILAGWGILENEFISYFKSKLGVDFSSINDVKNKDILKKIKQHSNSEIAKIITNDKKLSDFIFFGIGNFEEPFTAMWLFEKNELKKNYILPFTITTGSGRSKGVYTIVVKPKG
jgi:hypothetical protein